METAVPLSAEQGHRYPILLWVGIAAASFWISGIAHELAHLIGVGLAALVLPLAHHPLRISLIGNIAGPAMSWLMILLACGWARQWKQNRHAHQHLLPWAVCIGFAAGTRFLLLGISALLLVGGVATGMRPDEYRIGGILGVPVEVLLLAELGLTLICWAYLLRTAQAEVQRSRWAAIIIGIITGFALWMGIAHVFNIQMMM